MYPDFCNVLRLVRYGRVWIGSAYLAVRHFGIFIRNILFILPLVAANYLYYKKLQSWHVVHGDPVEKARSKWISINNLLDFYFFEYLLKPQ